nr:DUF2235 domain-containing protein [Sulfitobacter algicola]
MRDQLLGLVGHSPDINTDIPPHPRGRVDHLIILDGTLSSSRPGHETNAGQAYNVIKRIKSRKFMSLYYAPGLQFHDVRSGFDAAIGRGMDTRIKEAYGFLACRYRPGDRIFLIGYSRGAYAARSLAGLIGRVGLLRSEYATVRHIRKAYRRYKNPDASDIAIAFRNAYCHPHTQIEALALWETVKALGVRLPIIRHFSDRKHSFHDHKLGDHVNHGFHALAIDETRKIFEPIMWERCGTVGPKIEQMWFRGVHGDIGGQVGGYPAARPLSNIPLVWILKKLEDLDVKLPAGWHDEIKQDALAPSVGKWRRGGFLFLSRGKRRVGMHKTEMFHPTLAHDIKTLSQITQAAE